MIYNNYFKRITDISISLISLIILSPLFLTLSIIGLIVMKGNPFFIQQRPGKKDKNGKEKIFSLIKFRTMSNKKDNFGRMLPDEKRLNSYGKFLRTTSLDELPELWNILIGDMSIIGPRPQLIKDLVFMNQEQRNRHNVRPGLSGLAQVNGRNNITWHEKFDYDLIYIRNITLMNDFKLMIQTLFKVFKRENIVREGTSSDIDYGDWLLLNGFISENEYREKNEKIKSIIRG